MKIVIEVVFEKQLDTRFYYAFGNIGDDDDMAYLTSNITEAERFSNDQVILEGERILDDLQHIMYIDGELKEYSFYKELKIIGFRKIYCL